MTFRHIVGKNLKYNFRRFVSYLFVNSFVVAVLFMYGSLLFNESLARDAAMQLVSDYIDFAAYAIIAFSVGFVSYTGIYFVKSRGKEFGVYLTLGMTGRDLLRMIVFESLVVVAGSAACGILAGLLLSKLFYLILAKILGLTASIYFISYKTYLLSLGVFLFMFLCNLLFTARFIRKLSILQITKAASMKELSRSRPIVGSIAVVVFGLAIWLSQAAIRETEFARRLMGESKSTWMLGIVLAVLVSLYFVIASGIDAVRAVLSRFPKLYNRNILVLSGLSHRFFAYKVSLYIVSLLIALSLLFSGFGLSLYSYTKKSIDEFFPYDFMIESTGNVNVVGEADIRAIIEANGGTLASFSALPFIRTETYRQYPNRLVHDYRSSIIVSESAYSRHMGTPVDVAPGEVLKVHNVKGEEKEAVGYDSILTVEPWSAGNDRALGYGEGPIDPDRFAKELGTTPKLTFEQGKSRSEYASFIDSYGNVEFEGVTANVVDDAVYASLPPNLQHTAYLFNLRSGDGDRIFAAILDALREKNGDPALWPTPETKFVAKDSAEFLRPIYKAERYELSFRINAFMLFSFAFMGLLFLVSSFVVLYYKVVTDLDEEKEKVALLRKIGLTAAECRAYVQKHLAIVFFAPLLIGGLPVLYYLYLGFEFTAYVGFIMGRIGLMYAAFALLNVLFFAALRKRFFRGAGLAATPR